MRPLIDDQFLRQHPEVAVPVLSAQATQHDDRTWQLIELAHRERDQLFRMHAGVITLCLALASVASTQHTDARSLSLFAASGLVLLLAVVGTSMFRQCLVLRNLQLKIGAAASWTTSLLLIAELCYFDPTPARATDVTTVPLRSQEDPMGITVRTVRAMVLVDAAAAAPLSCAGAPTEGHLRWYLLALTPLLIGAAGAAVHRLLKVSESAVASELRSSARRLQTADGS